MARPRALAAIPPRLHQRSREGTLAQTTMRDVAVGEGPLRGRAVGGRGGVVELSRDVELEATRR